MRFLTLHGDDGMESNPSSSMPIHAAIGRVAVEWANLEAFVDYAAVGLAGFDDKLGACFTSQISGINRKLDAFIAITRYILGGDHAIIKGLNRFHKRAMGIAEKRHRILHDPWDELNVETLGPRRFQITARKSLVYGFVPGSVDDVTKLASEIAVLTEEFDGLQRRAREEVVGASTEKR